MELSRVLLGDRFAPITSEIGFVENPIDQVVDCFEKWTRPIQAKRGVSLRRERFRGDLESLLRKLLPLTLVEVRRYLFVPTHSDWIAFLDSGAHGTDASSVMPVMSHFLRCRTLRLTCVADTRSGSGQTARGRFGAVIFQLWSPAGNRSVVCANDGGKWVFEASGDPLGFEITDAYHDRHVRNRFQPDALLAYAKALGLSPFDEDFYDAATRDAMLIEKIGPLAPKAREISLDEARARF